ncbi:MAG: glycoside hydrolase family 28 protein [Pirellulaceae bacterium]|nr:glycoside hydrolase family 28 protein [Pirellulaceae bacterium]
MCLNRVDRRLRLIGAFAVLSLLCWSGPVSAADPTRVYCVAEYGAVADGETLTTAALQKAIDACSAAGGGTVHFPAGKYLTGTIFLRDRVTLHLDAGAVILGSTNLNDYPPQRPAFRSYTDVNYVDKSLIYAERVHDAAITGRGVIDGQGNAAVFQRKPYKKRPYLMRMIECKNLAVRDITLRNSAMWVQHYLGCENLLIDGITVYSLDNKNNDGIDIDSCDRVRIANCDIVAEDDAIVLKSTTPRPCRRVTITNCTLSSLCNGLKLGTESVGGFQDIAISNCVVYDTRLSGIALELVDGGKLERVVVSNITMNNARSAIFIRLGNRARPYLATQLRGAGGPFDADATREGTKRPGVGSLRDVIISNVVATGVDKTGCAIAGLPDHPIENVILQNIRITYAGGGGPELADRDVPQQEARYPEYTMFGPLPAYGFYCRHVRNIRFDNVVLDYEQAEHRPALVCDDVKGLRLNGFEAKKPLSGDTIRLVNTSDVRGLSAPGVKNTGAP